MPQQVACGCCHFQFDLTQALTDTVGRVMIKHVNGPEEINIMGMMFPVAADEEQEPPKPMCHTCAHKTMLGQLVAPDAGQQAGEQQ